MGRRSERVGCRQRRDGRGVQSGGWLGPGVGRVPAGLPDPGKHPRTIAEADQDVTRYRYFLKLCLLYPGVAIVPDNSIDRAWHAQVLDTAKYRRDCTLVFGRFLDHFPYAGLRGDADRRTWLDSFARTRELFRQHFSVKLGPVTASGCSQHYDLANCCVGCEGTGREERPLPDRADPVS